MKKLLLLIIICSISLLNAAAQVPAGNAIIKGIVVDSAKATPLGYVTIGVRPAGKKEALKSTYTQDNGSFEFTGLPVQAYEVVVNYVGYKSRTVAVPAFPENNPVVNLGKLTLSATTSRLKEVEVTAQKLLIKQDIDKITYDVEADPESKTMTALDMLRKVPLVTVDAEDNIQLKGSGSYRVLVNGKTSSLFVRDPKEVLKSMPAHTIKNIEVITNPPAKYEAEGVGGIINIITVKKSPGGYNGSINAGARTPVGYNLGGYLTAKTGKFGFSGYYGHNYNESPSTENNLFRDDYIRKIRLNQRGVNDNHGTFNYLDGNLSFELDSLNLITGNFSFNVSESANNLSQQVLNTTYAGTPELSYSRFSKGAFSWHGYDLGLDYQKSFRRNKEQLFTLSYKFNNGGNDSDTDFRLEYTDRPLVYSTTQNNGASAEHTIQADYLHPIGKNNLEIGLKTITRLNSSDYFYANLNPDNGEYVLDPTQSNNFDYHQDIFAGYTSYSYKKGDWGLKLGARLEQTRINANFASSGTIAEQDYFNLIPSIALSRKLKGMKNVRLGYTQRIERPGLWYLNPYVNRIDPRNIYFGNPDLRAATNHAFDLAYSTFVKKTSVNTSLFYNFTNNSIQQFTTLGTDSVARTTYGNIGKNQRLGFSLNTNMNVTKNLNVNLNASANFVQLNGVITVTDTATNTNTLTPVSNNGITANVFGYLSYKFGKRWRASGNIGYNSPQILLQGTSAGFAYNSFSVTRTFFEKDKGSINLSISSPFQRNRRFFNELQDTRFYQNSESFYVMRRLNLSFNYRFGKLQSDIARKKRGIKNDDVSGGGQGGGATN